jgi:hypothetical protein
MQFAMAVPGGGGDQSIQAPFALPTNVWTHLAVEMDGRQAILYVNGQAVAVNNSVNLLPSDIGATKCYFGRSQFSADAYFRGQLDSVRLNSRALSLAEIIAPIPLITAPTTGTSYAGGGTLTFAGAATDYADMPLPPAAYTWSAEFHHDGETDAAFGPLSGVTNGTFLIPTNGPLSTNVFYRVNLLVTDAAGNQAGASADVPPKTTRLNFTTVPPSLQLALDGQLLTAPTSVVVVAGLTRSVSAPTPQIWAGSNYDFVVWSDGGTATHSVSVPTTNATFTASYVLPAVNLGLASSNVVLSWPDWAGSLNLASTTNLTPPTAWSLVPAMPAATNGVLTVMMPVSGNTRFYRLQSP